MQHAFAFFVGCLLPLIAVRAQQPESDVHLSLSSPTNLIEYGESVTLTATIENSSTNDVYIGRREKLLDVVLIISDEHGNEVPITRYHQYLLKMKGHLGEYVHTLEPGESWNYRLPLMSLYDMSVPGTYSIRAKRAVLVENGENRQQVTLESPELKILIRRMSALLGK